MRLIDEDELKSLYDDAEFVGEKWHVHIRVILANIDDMPTVNSIKHGKWIDKYGDGDWHCTRCGAIVEKHEQDYRNWYFCYHCGARMDGDENG